jgi:plasmid stabilization system protein ParE
VTGTKSETRSLPTSVTDPRKPYKIHDEATLDLRLAARWYNRRRGGLGAEFVLAVDAAIAKIVEAPRRWPPFAGARRYILRRFPYNVIYRVRRGTDPHPCHRPPQPQASLLGPPS